MTRLASLLGFATKAGKLIAGSAAVEAGLKSSRICLVICAADLSAKTIKNFKFLADQRSVSFFTAASCLEIGQWIGKPGRGVIGITSEQFAIALRSELINQE